MPSDTMSDDYHDDEELDDFIVSDDEPQEIEDEPENAPDRLAELNATLKVNESYTTKVLRAHISVLVSALGGPDHTSKDHVYKLGHDALACLKDIKRWIRSVDDRNGGHDVALACADCGLFNDLCVILTQWYKPPPGFKKTKTTEKVVLACLELMVLLTWPVEVSKATPMQDYPAKTAVRRTQVAYKHHVLQFQNGRTLKAIVRMSLPYLQMPRHEREPRDTSILRLVLFFIRNVVATEPLPRSRSPKGIVNSADLPVGISADDIGTSAVLCAFEKNNVLLYLTTVAHTLTDGDDDTFGALVVECVALIVRTVPVESLFVDGSKLAKNDATDTNTNNAIGSIDTTSTVPPAASSAGLHLQDLLKEESKRRRNITSQSTRHGRFGTLLSLQTPNSNYTVSGQQALASTHDMLGTMDRAKTWLRPSAFRYDSNGYVKDTVPLTGHATTILSRFVDQLLVSGAFNNLLRVVSHHLTSLTMDRGMLDAVDARELASYFLAIAWFFRYKRERASKGGNVFGEDALDYGSVGAALSEVNFVLLISYCRSAYEAKDYNLLHVALVCLHEMLMISSSVFLKEKSQRELELVTEADINEDRELAEGIMRKLFSQKQFLDVMVSIPKTAAKHSPEYLSVSVSVVHVLLKCFEALANEDVKLYIKTRRKMNKLQRSGLNADMAREHADLIDRGSGDEDEDQIRYITQERKLDFSNTEVRFFHTDIVLTHITYLTRFEDLTNEEIKRGISYFHRLFVVRKDFSALFRLDFMNVIYRLRSFLPRSSSNRRHVDDFIVYYMKKFKVAFERFPVAIELLFPRFENIEVKGFISTGDVDPHVPSKTTSKASGLPTSSYFTDDSPQPRAAVQLQFADEIKLMDEKISILIYHLVKKKNVLKVVKFLISELDRLAQLKKDGITQVMLRLNLGFRRLMINDAHLRLLVEVLGFNTPFLQNDETVLRQDVDADQLLEGKESIEKWIRQHEIGVGDIEPFLDQVHVEIFLKEQLDFGIAALADIRAGRAVDAEKLIELGLSELQLHKVIGLAKRKEYDENIASQYYDDDFTEPPLDSISDDEKDKPRRSRRELVDALDFDDKPVRRRRKLLVGIESDDESQIKSAEMVHDSDDESDDELARAFFAREEQLRQLISRTGGIINKELLEEFKTSWQQIVGSNQQMKSAIDKANLFVAELDEEPIFSQNDTPTSFASEEENSKRKIGEDFVARKRRVVLDDDE